jgi:hypothetical protein
VRQHRAVQRDDALVHRHQQRPRHHLVEVGDDSAGLGARQQRAVGSVGPVGEAFQVDSDAGVADGGRQDGTGRAQHRQPGRGGGIDDRRHVRGGVVEGAVRLEVADRGALDGGERL